MYSRFIAVLAVSTSLALITAPVAAVPIYADSVTTQDVTFFGSGVLTGAPDGGGAFLSNTFDPPTLLGSITAGFAGGFTNGAGIDLTIHENGGPLATEIADVFVSNDGLSFTFIGQHTNGNNMFDLEGLFAGVVHFVRVVNNAQASNSADIDAFEAVYAAPAVPEPASLALVGLGLIGMRRFARR